MPIGQIHLASNTPSTNGDEESNDQTEDGDNVIVDEETKFIPSRLIDKAGRLNIRTEELDIRNPFTFRNKSSCRLCSIWSTVNCPNFRTNELKVWTVLSAEDIY